jgi:hypothetical protein
VGLLIGALDEELRVKPLAHQSALHIDLNGQHGVDRAMGDVLLEIVESVWCAHEKTRSVGCDRLVSACSVETWMGIPGPVGPEIRIVLNA